MTTDSNGPDSTDGSANPTGDAPAVNSESGHSRDATGPDYESFFLIPVIEALLNGIKTVLSKQMVDVSSRFAAMIGMWALIAFAGLALIYGAMIGFYISDFRAFGVMAGAAVIAIALLYTAGKFCSAGLAIIESSPSQLSSKSFLDSLALLSAGLAVVFFFGGIVYGIQERLMLPVGVGVAVAAWWAYMTAASLNPSLVNMTIQSGASAGQECLGIVSFLLKAMLRIVPIVFGVAVTVGTAFFFIGIIRHLVSDDKFVIWLDMLGMTTLILYAAALPFVVYLATVVSYLAIDLARSILKISSR